MSVSPLTKFFDAWIEADPVAQAEQIKDVMSPDFHYADPRSDGRITDIDALCSYVAQFLPMCPPGAKVVVADPVDEIGGHFRATVRFVMSEDMVQIGQYFGKLGDDGKVRRIYGFVGKGAE